MAIGNGVVDRVDGRGTTVFVKVRGGGKGAR